jgi:hypothetical protein
VETILASDVPASMDIVVITNVGVDVQLTWTAPFNSYETIDQYDLEIRKVDGTFYADSIDCPGTPVSLTTCMIDMNMLRIQSGLSQGALIRAVIRAHNINGWGLYSQINFNGAVIQTSPLAMNTPSFDIPTSSLTQVNVTWAPVIDNSPATGGIPLSGYTVFYQDNTTSTWLYVNSTTIGYTVISSLTPGVFYNFKVVVVNLYG